MSEEKKHDYGKWLIIYSVFLNFILLVSLGTLLFVSFRRCEWNAGWVA